MSASQGQQILVTGTNGQVGYELARSLQGLGSIVALRRSELDLSNPSQIREVMQRIRPALVINPAAYTAVDKAESETALAHQINAVSAGVLGKEAAKLGVPLIHYSTDYVFKGDKEGEYIETDAPNPQNIYGRTKLLGEQAIIDSGCAYVILRTSWVYGNTGANFVKTMLRLSSERSKLRVVSDQLGAPTWARTLADLTAHIVSQGLASSLTKGGDTGDQAGEDWWRAKSGIYHMTSGGHTNWAEFAETIFDMQGIACEVDRISTSDYPTPAKRPINSRLSNDKLRQAFGLTPPHWRDALQLCLAQMPFDSAH